MQVSDETVERLVLAIAYKATPDEALREDAAQQARMALCTLSAERRACATKPYLAALIRNQVSSYLKSYQTGDWYTGRRIRKGLRGGARGTRVRVSEAGRYVRIDPLLDMGYLQISLGGQLLPGERAELNDGDHVTELDAGGFRQVSHHLLASC